MRRKRKSGHAQLNTELPIPLIKELKAYCRANDRVPVSSITERALTEFLAKRNFQKIREMAAEEQALEDHPVYRDLGLIRAGE